MKKGLFLVACFVLVFAGCSNPVKEDLLNYINNELPKVGELENIAVAAWDSVSGNNYTDDYTMYDTLTEIVIPKYREFLTGMESITVRLKTSEVRALNEKYIDAITSTNSAFVMLKNILETQDGSRMAEANERLDRGRRLVREWQVEIQDLCRKNGIQFNT